ncbi:heavy metal translocating P-type ATPase [Candidatus Avelusimicrobium facis]|uniref:heavy metal translocating P-type ATPase n=1 Tax=Candidatus Avelusimicrobium facis TaxID=3416203 RepID=UPI0015B697BA
MKQKFIVSGMHCAACAARVERTVHAVPGVMRAEVNLLQQSMQVEYEEGQTAAKAVIAAVQQAGFDAQLPPKEPVQDPSVQEERYLRRRFWSSLGFLLPLLYVSMGAMAGWVPAGLAQHLGWLAAVQFILTLPVLYINREVFANGFLLLLRAAPNMNSLIALGSGAAVLSGGWTLVQAWGGMPVPEHALYFESAAMILTLVTLGKWLEARAKRKTSGAVGQLLQLAPQRALRIENGAQKEIPAAEIAVGDVLAVKAGMSVPADGTLLRGHGTLEEAALTGESLPVEKSAGQTVHAGTLNQAGYFEMQVVRCGEQTLLGQMIALVEQAAASKAPIGRLADKVSGVFVPVVLGLAALAALGWALCGGSAEQALRAAVAVLVISCPCALGLATPTAIMVGMGVGAKRGILFKSAAALERAQAVDCVVLDKTGTVTRGRPEVTQQWLADEKNEYEFWSLLASAESLSEHPLSRAVLRAPLAQGRPLFTAEEFAAFPGAGISARVQGRRVAAGNLNFMRQEQVPVPLSEETRAQQWAAQGQTVLYVALDGKLAGMLGLADPLRPQAEAAVKALQQLGMEVILLTGDQERTAQAVARQLRIDDVIAGVLPQDKAAAVKRLQSRGLKVAMVGDGVNDAPALACAEVGVAVGGGTDAALETADIVLVKNDLTGVVTAWRLSRAVLRNIKENLFWAFFYNVCGIPLAAGVFYPWLGWQLNPMWAAAAMSLSSVCVVGNALRLRKFKG